MTWTSKKPTVTGWYWLQDGTGQLIVRIEIGMDDSHHLEYIEWAGVGTPTPLALIGPHCSWAGPIPSPEEG